MWELSADYVMRVLQPAAERFTRGEGLPDLFTRYDLPYDVESRADIEKALEQVRSVWNKQRNHPVLNRLVLAMMTPEELGNAQRTLLNAEGRAVARAVAEKNRKKAEAAQFEKLDRAITLAAAKGYMTPEERAEIGRQYATIPAAEIDKRIRVPIKGGSSKREERPEVVPATVRSNVRRSLGALARKDLLEFLGLRRGATKEDVERAYERVQREWRAHAADQKKSSAQELLGVLKQYFVGRDPALFDALHEADLLDGFRPDMLIVLAKKSLEATEIEALVAGAVRIGIPEARARQYILDAARDAGATVGGTAKSTIVCTNCGTANADLTARVCVTCRASLWRNCPRCREENPQVALACGKCGFELGKWEEIALLIRQALLALDDGDISGAERLAERIDREWGREGEAARLYERLGEAQRATRELARQAQEAIAQKRLYAARELLSQLQRRSPGFTGPGGITLNDWIAQLAVEIAKIASIVTRARSHETRREFRDAYIAYSQAQAIVVDAPEVKQGLERPPEPATNVVAKFDGSAVIVLWNDSPAAGDIRYCVVRGEGVAPKTPGAGTKIGETVAKSIRDTTPVAGSQAIYGVFVLRGEMASEGCCATPLLINADVEGAVTRPGDGLVRGEWKPHRGVRVRVFRSGGGAAGETEVPDVAPTRFEDRAVQNGTTYTYRIVVEYAGPTSAVSSRGVRLTVTPEKPPEPVRDLKLALENDGLHVRWTPPPRGSVAVVRVAPPLRWTTPGQIIPMSDVSSATHLLALSNSEAVDRKPPNGTSCYLALTVTGSSAVVGGYSFFSNLPDVADMTAEDFGEYIQLRWVWPDGCRLVRMSWSKGAPAVSANTIRGESTEITLAEYHRGGSLRVEAGPGTWYFRAFARGDDGGFSSGLAAGANAIVKTRRGAVRYSLSRGRIFGRSKVKLTLESREAVTVPEIVVVAAHGEHQPQTPSDGREVLRIQAQRLDASRPRDFDFDIGAAPLPVFVRAFFSNPHAYDDLELHDPPPSEARMH